MMTSEKPRNMKPIPNRVAEVDAYMEEKVGLGVSFDLGVRRIKVLRKDVHLYYINGLTDTEYIIGISGFANP